MSDDAPTSSEVSAEYAPVDKRLRRAARIPLDIVVTATGDRTPGVIIAVLAADLDAVETRLWEMNELAASLAGHFTVLNCRPCPIRYGLRVPRWRQISR